MDPDPEPGLLSFIPILFFPLIAIDPFSIALVSIFLLLIMSGLISGSEVAFFSLTPGEMTDLEKDKSRSADRIIQLKKYPKELLATILISNNFINIAIVVTSTYVLNKAFSQSIINLWATKTKALMTWLPLDENVISKILSFLILVLLVTFILVLFGEVLPKVYARTHKLKLAKRMSLPLSLLGKIFYPFSLSLIAGTTELEQRLVPPKSRNGKNDKTEIDKAIELTLGHEAGINSDVDILKGILKFQDVSVTQIMKSRVDMVAIDKSDSYKELLNIIKSSGYSRIPVFEEELDKIIGILYAKDLISHIDKKPDYQWQRLIKKNVLFVPEAKKIYELLREFQSKRTHMAIVVDEYGGSSGLITLEDILEEVIGEIKDEFDEEKEVNYIQLDKHNYEFEAKTLLNDMCKIFDLDTDHFDDVRGDADSIAGMVLEVMGMIPKKNREVTVKRHKFKILKADSRKIDSVRITLPRD